MAKNDEEKEKIVPQRAPKERKMGKYNKRGKRAQTRITRKTRKVQYSLRTYSRPNAHKTRNSKERGSASGPGRARKKGKRGENEREKKTAPEKNRMETKKRPDARHASANNGKEKPTRQRQNRTRKSARDE